MESTRTLTRIKDVFTIDIPQIEKSTFWKTVPLLPKEPIPDAGVWGAMERKTDLIQKYARHKNMPGITCTKSL